jgi:NADPH:quinone reductase-like Zn-dependent oxidoreductase
MPTPSPTNKAALLPSAKTYPFVIDSAPYTAPSENELVVRTHAIALNAFDAMLQHMGPQIAPWLTYPTILGSDVAGTIVECGSAITRFHPGDRVVGLAISIDKHSKRACEGAFQEYVVLRSNLVSKIPDTMAFEQAAVLPLTLSTAACGLFMKDYLSLAHPSTKTAPGSRGEVLLIWGGSTGVGSNAIQLAVAAGYDVITTASPKNFEYVKKLGASWVFDYRSPATAIRDIIAVMKGKKSAGALAIGDGSLEACIPIIAASTGRKFIAQASVPSPKSVPAKGLVLVKFIAGYLWFNVSTGVKCKVKGIGSKFIWGTDLVGNEVGSAIYEHFLPQALATGWYVAKPEPNVIGHGLEMVQEGLDRLIKGGLSTEKIVVTV